jgi:hypothetical protein
MIPADIIMKYTDITLDIQRRIRGGSYANEASVLLGIIERLLDRSFYANILFKEFYIVRCLNDIREIFESGTPLGEQISLLDK